MPNAPLSHRCYEIDTGAGFVPASPSMMLQALLQIAGQCNPSGFLALMDTLRDGNIITFPRPTHWQGPTALSWSLRFRRPNPEEN